MIGKSVGGPGGGLASSGGSSSLPFLRLQSPSGSLRSARAACWDWFCFWLLVFARSGCADATGAALGFWLAAALDANRSEMFTTVPAERGLAAGLLPAAAAGGWFGAAATAVAPFSAGTAGGARMLFGVSACIDDVAERAVLGSWRELREDCTRKPMLDSTSALDGPCGWLEFASGWFETLEGAWEGVPRVPPAPL